MNKGLLRKSIQVERDLELIRQIVTSSALDEMNKIAIRALERYNHMVEKYMAGKIRVNHNTRSIIFE